MSTDANSVHVSEEGPIIRNVTVVCYLFSILSFGMGYSKMLVYMDAITEHLNSYTYDHTIDLSLATSFLVLAIFFAVVGFAFFTLRLMEHKNRQKETTLRKNQCVYSCDSR